MKWCAEQPLKKRRGLNFQRFLLVQTMVSEAGTIGFGAQP